MFTGDQDNVQTALMYDIVITYLCSLLIDDLPLPSIRQAPSNQSNVIAIHQDHGGHPLYNLELKHTISIPVVVDGQVLSHGVYEPELCSIAQTLSLAYRSFTNHLLL